MNAKQNPQTKQPSKVLDILGQDYRPSVSRQSSRTTSKKGAVTVVSTKGNGKRVAIDQEVINKIGSPERVQIALNDVAIAIGERFTPDDNYFNLRKAANKAVIYSSQLVAELTEAFELDFTKTTSVSFQDVSYQKVGSRDIAIVKMIRDVVLNTGAASSPSHNVVNPNVDGRNPNMDDKADAIDPYLDVDNEAFVDSGHQDLDTNDEAFDDSDDKDLNTDDEAFDDSDDQDDFDTDDEAFDDSDDQDLDTDDDADESDDPDLDEDDDVSDESNDQDLDMDDDAFDDSDDQDLDVDDDVYYDSEDQDFDGTRSNHQPIAPTSRRRRR